MDATSLYNLAKKYFEDYEKYRDQAKDLKDYITKIETFSKEVSTVKRHVDYSTAEFSNGGYVCDGVSFASSKFALNISRLTSVEESLNNIISKSNVQIEFLIEKKEEAYELYKKYWNQYQQELNNQESS